MKQKLLLFLFLFSTAFSFGQKPDLSGTWNFKEQSSISGRLYSNGSPKSYKITQTATQITLESTSAGQSGDVVSSQTIPFDGKQVESETASKRKRLASITWSADNKSFIEITGIYNAADPTKLEYRNTDAYFIENGELVLDRKSENFTNGETWESKAIYEKQ